MRAMIRPTPALFANREKARLSALCRINATATSAFPISDSSRVVMSVAFPQIAATPSFELIS